MGKYLKVFIYKYLEALLTIREYPYNFLIHFFVDILTYILMVIFYLVFREFIGNLVNWTLFDFFVYTVLIYTIHKFSNLFSLLKLKSLILSGKLNKFLFLPINTYFYTCLNSMKERRVITTILNFIILIILILYGNYFNLILFALFFIFSIFYFLFFYNLFYVLDFWLFGNNPFYDIFLKTEEINKRFLPVIFSEYRFGSLFLFLPTSISGYFIFEILKGNLIIINYLYLIIIIFIFLVVLNFLLWHYGLKKYEAFN